MWSQVSGKMAMNFSQGIGKEPRQGNIWSEAISVRKQAQIIAIDKNNDEAVA